MDTTTQIIVAETGSHLDRYITEHLSDLSRAAVQRLIEDGHMLADGQANPSILPQVTNLREDAM